MSSQLTTLVPILTGPNYQQWAPMMKSFLMAQGQWRTLLNKRPGTKEETDPETGVTSENTEAQDKWDDINDKAVGNI